MHFSFKVLKRLKKFHSEGRNGYLPSSGSHAAKSNEAHHLTPKNGLCREFATTYTKLTPWLSSPSDINHAKEDASKLMRSREQSGNEYDIGKTIKEPPPTDNATKRLKVRSPSFPSKEQAGSICRMAAEGNKKPGTGDFMPGVLSRA